MTTNISSLLAASIALMSFGTPVFVRAEKITASNPVITRVLEGQVQQTKIGNCNYRESPIRLYKQMEIDSDEGGDLRISGFSSDGSAWRANINFDPGADCEVWTAALSPGNPPSIIIRAGGIDSSGGWDTELSILLFDKQGKPMPWQAISYFDVNEKGVQEIVRFPGSEKASIVVPIREGDKFDGFAYLYDLYDIVGDRVQRITGARYGVKWPLLPQQRPDIEAHHLLDTLSTVEPPEKDVLNDSSSRIKKLLGDADSKLVIELGNGSSIRRPRILVEDQAGQGRSIIFDPTQNDLRNLVKANATGQVIGKRCDWDECTPLILKTNADSLTR
jgi:hypothetical protein